MPVVPVLSLEYVMIVRPKRFKLPEYCVLMGSVNRVDVLTETLTRQGFLDRPNTYIALHSDQWKKYAPVRNEFSRITYLRYDNPHGSVSVMCETLRVRAVSDGYERYVRMDDNCGFTLESLHNLLRASVVYPKQPVVVGGMQGGMSADTKPSRFDEAYAKKSGHTVAGLRFYKKIAMMFWCFPHELYQELSFPKDRGCMEDHYAALTCLELGATFVTCMDAPFKKHRFQKGGQGDPAARAKKIGYAWLRFADMYPQYMAHVRMVWPYAKFYKMMEKKRDEDPFA